MGRAEVVVGRRLELSLGGRFLQIEHARLPVQRRQITKRGHIVEIDRLGLAEHLGVGGSLQVYLLHQLQALVGQARADVDGKKVFQHARRRAVADLLQRCVTHGHRIPLLEPGPAVDGGERQLDLRIGGVDPRPEGSRLLRVLAQEMTQTEAGLRDSPVSRLHPGLRAEPLQVSRRFSGVAALEQHAAEIQTREPTSASAANGRQPFQIVELDRDSRFTQLAMKPGVVEIDHAERQICGRATGWIQHRQACLECAGRLLIMTPLIQRHRARYRVVRRRRRPGHQSDHYAHERRAQTRHVLILQLREEDLVPLVDLSAERDHPVG